MSVFDWFDRFFGARYLQAEIATLTLSNKNLQAQNEILEAKYVACCKEVEVLRHALEDCQKAQGNHRGIQYPPLGLA